MIVSSIGFAYFVYGKKQQKAVPLLSGIALMAFPYFVKNMLLFSLLAVALMVIPFLIKE